jgi:CarD family transcriptional regulator, regulator of rRNA transcription
MAPLLGSDMSTGDLNFHIGDKVVYPNHGVGVIEQISSRSIGATIEKFYLLHIKASSLKVMVPCHSVGSVGLRRVIRNGEIQKVLDFLSVSDTGSNGDWKDRFKENSDRMRTGSLLEVAVVLKSLVSLSRSKPLSFREKKMLERAKYLLVTEMATARNTSPESAETMVVKSLAKAKLQFPVMMEKFE